LAVAGELTVPDEGPALPFECTIKKSYDKTVSKSERKKENVVFQTLFRHMNVSTSAARLV
jgi:hypothetical protein